MSKIESRVLPEERRQEIFRAVVEAQDGGASVVESRKQVVKRFGVTERELRQIETEGLDNEWPPL